MPVPLVYVSDLTYDDFDPADLFDLAFLLCSPEHDLRGVCLADQDADGDRTLDALTTAARRVTPYLRGTNGLRDALQLADEPVNVVVVGGYGSVETLYADEPELFRAKVARLFLVGGFANDYSRGRLGERLPIDPRLKERNPERFPGGGDPRTGREPEGFARLLISGEAVIWLPRDICLWRYDAPGMLTGRGELNQILLRELFWWNLRTIPDRYEAASAPVLLSALPALLLATRPDPFLWMRLFRCVTARVGTDASGLVTEIAVPGERPNLYLVNALDGANLSQRMTQGLIKPEGG